MQNILIITDQPIAGLGIDFALKKHLKGDLTVKLKPFDKNNPIGLLEENYNGLIFCLTSKSAEKLSKSERRLRVPTLICADINNQAVIQNLCGMGMSGLLNLKNEITQVVAALKVILTGEMYVPN